MLHNTQRKTRVLQRVLCIQVNLCACALYIILMAIIAHKKLNHTDSDPPDLSSDSIASACSAVDVKSCHKCERESMSLTAHSLVTEWSVKADRFYSSCRVQLVMREDLLERTFNSEHVALPVQRRFGDFTHARGSCRSSLTVAERERERDREGKKERERERERGQNE